MYAIVDNKKKRVYKRGDKFYIHGAKDDGTKTNIEITLPKWVSPKCPPCKVRVSPKVKRTKTRSARKSPKVKTTKSPKVKRTKSPKVKRTKSPKVKRTKTRSARKSPKVKRTKSPKVKARSTRKPPRPVVSSPPYIYPPSVYPPSVYPPSVYPPSVYPDVPPAYPPAYPPYIHPEQEEFIRQQLAGEFQELTRLWEAEYRAMLDDAERENAEHLPIIQKQQETIDSQKEKLRECDVLRARVQSLEDELSTTTSHRERLDLETELAFSQNQLIDSQNEVDKLRSDFFKQEAVISSLSGELQRSIQAKNYAMERNIKAYDDELANLRQHIGNLESSNSVYKTEVEDQVKVLHQRNETIQDLEGKYRSLEVEYNTCEADASYLENTLRELQVERTTLQARLLELERIYELSDKRLGDYKERDQSFILEKSKLQDDLKKCHDEEAKLNTANFQLIENLKKCDARGEQLVATIEDLNRQIVENKDTRQLAYSEADRERLFKESQKCKVKTGKLIENLRKCGDKGKQMTETIRDLQLQLEYSEADREKMFVTSLDLTAENKHLQETADRLVELEATNNDLVRQLGNAYNKESTIVEEMNRRTTDIQTKYDELGLLYVRVSNDNQELLTKIHWLEGNLEVMKERLAEGSNENIRFERENISLKVSLRELPALESRITTNLAEIESLNAQLTASRKEVATLGEQLSVSRSEVATLKDQLVVRQQEAVTFQWNIAMLKGRLGAGQEQSSTLLEELNALRGQLAVSEEQSSTLLEELNALRGQLAEQREATALSSELRETVANISLLEERVTALQIQNRSYETQVLQCKGLPEENAKMLQELRRLRELRIETQEEIYETSETILDLKDQISDCDGKLRACAVERFDKASLARLESENEALRDELRSANRMRPSDLEELQHTIDELRDQLEEYEVQLSTCADDRLNRSKLEELFQENERLDRENKGLMSAIECSVRESPELAEQLQHCYSGSGVEE
jgi:chromosome segregation ATPase